MEISCGEYGDKVSELIIAAKSGLCSRFQSILDTTTGCIGKRKETDDDDCYKKVRISRGSVTSSSRWSGTVLDALVGSLAMIDQMKETAILDDSDEVCDESDEMFSKNCVNTAANEPLVQQVT